MRTISRRCRPRARHGRRIEFRSSRVQFAQRAPVGIVAHGEADPSILAMQRQRRGGVTIGPVADRFGRRTSLRRQQRIRRHHKIASIMNSPPGRPPRCPPAPEARGGGEGQHHPSIGSSQAKPTRGGRPDGGSGRRTGVALQQRSISDGVRLGARAAHARGGNVDQIGVFGAQCLGAKAEPVHHAGGEIFHQDVAGFTKARAASR